MRKRWHRYLYLKAFEGQYDCKPAGYFREDWEGFSTLSFDTVLLSPCKLVPGTENRAQAFCVPNEFPIKQGSYLLAPFLVEYSVKKSGTALTGRNCICPIFTLLSGSSALLLLGPGSKCSTLVFLMSISWARDMHSRARLALSLLWEIFHFCTLLKHAVNQREKAWWPRLKSLLAINQSSCWVFVNLVLIHTMW